MLKSVEEQIWNHARNNPEKIAIISGNHKVSYATLCSSVMAATDTYKNLGINDSQCVILSACKQIEFIYAYFAAHLSGIRVIPIDPETNIDRIQYIINETSACRLIGFEEKGLGIPCCTLSEFKECSEIFTTPIFPNIDSVADILFTTGTTGTPKGVQLTFANEASATVNINEYIGNKSDDIELLALPISHSFGLGRLRCCLSTGASIILLGNFANIKKLYRIMGEKHVTGFSMVPASWRYLQKMSGDKITEFKDQLRYIEMGSSYMSGDEKIALARLLPRTRICMHYGLTEASRSTFIEFHEDNDYIDSVGKASPHTVIKIFDEQGNECPIDTEGEICIKGTHVTNGYLNVSNNHIFWGDYFRTGDWGHLSKDSYLYLSSRKKELINVGGKKVSPLEVETQIMKVKGVYDCACVAAPDKDGYLGEVVKAYIVKEYNTDITFQTIRDSIEGTLEYYKLPTLWEWIDKIPRTQNGKIQRNLLS
jgi:long-chain acyl-CoA synthetase